VKSNDRWIEPLGRMLVRLARRSLASRWLLLSAAILAAAYLGSRFPQLWAPLRSIFPPKAQVAEPVEQEAPESVINLTHEQIAAANIGTARAGPGLIKRQVTVPAALKPEPDHVARVAAKVSGVIAEMRKKLGDEAQKGETIAVVDSREVADAFEVPMRFLMDEANHQKHARPWKGRDRHYYAMPYEDRYIWGATAGMIKNLHQRLWLGLSG